MAWVLAVACRAWVVVVMVCRVWVVAVVVCLVDAQAAWVSAAAKL